MFGECVRWWEMKRFWVVRLLEEVGWIEFRDL